MKRYPEYKESGIYTPLRSLKEIADEILALKRTSEGLLNEVIR